MLASQVNGGNFDGNGDGIVGDDLVLVGSPSAGPKLFRLFGDTNGDGSADNIDFGLFRQAIGSDAASPGWNSEFDANGDGLVDNVDFLAFRQRLGMTP